VRKGGEKKWPIKEVDVQVAAAKLRQLVSPKLKESIAKIVIKNGKIPGNAQGELDIA